MASPGLAHILVVAHGTTVTPALLAAVRDRAERGPARFELLFANPEVADWRVGNAERRRQEHAAEAEHVLVRGVRSLKDAAGPWVHGTVSRRNDPMDAIEETLNGRDFDEIVLETVPRTVARRLHVDLPRRVAHLGLPVTTVITPERGGHGRRVRFGAPVTPSGAAF